VGGAEVSEANGVLRNSYHPPGATIYRKETDYSVILTF